MHYIFATKTRIEHVTEYYPSASASGRYSVTCSNPHFGDKYNAYDLKVIYLKSIKLTNISLHLNLYNSNKNIKYITLRSYALYLSPK